MTDAPAPDPTESEPTPFPEHVGGVSGTDDSAEVDVRAIRETLRDIAKVPLDRPDTSQASLYYDASSMAPLSPPAAVRHPAVPDPKLPLSPCLSSPVLEAYHGAGFDRPPLPAYGRINLTRSPSGTSFPHGSAPPS